MYFIRGETLLVHLAKRPCKRLPSLGIRRLLTYHVLIFSFETVWPTEPNLDSKHLWKVLYKDCSFHSNSFTNMATIGKSCFWMVNFLKPPLKLLGQINWNLAECIYGRSSIKIAHFVSSQSINKHDHHMQFLFLVGRFLKIFSSETP